MRRCAKSVTSAADASAASVTITAEIVSRWVSTNASLSGIHVSPSMTVPGARIRPTTRNGRVSTITSGPPLPASVSTVARASGLIPAVRAALAPSATSLAPACGARPATSRACGCTMNAVGVMPRTRPMYSAASVLAGAALSLLRSITDRATLISGLASGRPSNVAMPLRLAATTPAADWLISLRSTLSSLPAPRRTTLRSWPLARSALAIPIANPAPAMERMATRAAPPTESISRDGLRPRLRAA